MAKFFDISYGNNEKQKMDLYLQKDAAPLIFYIHGGGWWQGDKNKDTQVYEALFATGFSIASINYRLADAQHVYPAQLDDARLALKWLKQSNYVFNHKRIALFGSSSGAHIALSLSIENGYPIVSWSGQFDFQGFLSTHTAIKGRKAADNPDPDKGSKMASYYKWILERLFDGDLSRAKSASLQHLVSPTTGPMLMFNSAAELAPVSEVYTMQQAFVENGLPITSIILPGDRHAQAYAKDALPVTISFLKNSLKIAKR
ncbi:alpha/beta hydrolase [Oenococcus sp.]|uniref:alpha/beta hydrolase n=1 Tax=Oenococcus sp. TaxID=1979414 RepID=UPI0039E82964